MDLQLRPGAAGDGGGSGAAAPSRSSLIGRYLLGCAVLGLGYYALAQAGTVVQFPGAVQAVWWPVGWAAGFLYLTGPRFWPGAVLADFVLGIGDTHLVTYFQTAGNGAEVLIAALLARRLLGARSPLARPDDVGRLLLAIATGTAFSATVGVATLRLSREIGPGETFAVWRAWWLGDGSGGLLLMPLMMTWWPFPVRGRPHRARILESVGLTVGLLGIGIIAFSGGHPLSYLVFPVLIWAALRFGLAGATAASALGAVIAVGMTANHRGPFVVSSIDDTVLNVHLYVVVAALTTLFLGAAVSARRRTARELALTQRREAEQATLARQRIARDLHDSVSQTLFGLTLQAATVEQLLAADRSGAAAEPVREVSRLAHGALAELRALIFELRPEALAEEGLVAALAKHGAALSVQRDVEITVAGPAERLPLTAEVEEQVYRLAQEALANAAKHSGARTIRLTVTVIDGVVEIRVRDDGCGFDPGQGFAGHLGMRTMRSRAAEIGGRLVIDSAPGAGTAVVASLPLVPVPPVAAVPGSAPIPALRPAPAPAPVQPGGAYPGGTRTGAAR